MRPSEDIHCHTPHDMLLLLSRRQLPCLLFTRLIIQQTFLKIETLSTLLDARDSEVKKHFCPWNISGRTTSPAWSLNDSGEWESKHGPYWGSSMAGVRAWWVQLWVPFLPASSAEDLPEWCYPSALLTPSLANDPGAMLALQRKSGISFGALSPLHFMDFWAQIMPFTLFRKNQMGIEANVTLRDVFLILFQKLGL